MDVAGASLLWLIAGALGFSDGFICVVASLIFTAMSGRRIREPEEKEHGGDAHSQSDVARWRRVCNVSPYRLRLCPPLLLRSERHGTPDAHLRVAR